MSTPATVIAEWHGPWVDQAACSAPGVDPELFFCDDHPNMRSRKRADAMALLICARCPVLEQCRAATDQIEKGTDAEFHPHGIRGGETAAERKWRYVRERQGAA